MSNLLTRIAVAAVGIPLLLWSCWNGSFPLIAVIVLLQIAMLFEWRGLVRRLGISLPIVVSLVLFAGLDFIVFAHDSRFARGIACGMLGLSSVALMVRSSETRLRDLGASAASVLYIALPLVLWYGLAGNPAPDRFPVANPLIVLLAATWLCDSGAYFMGRALGRHKLYVKASPNKTIEGAVGGLLFAALLVPILGRAGIASPTGLDYAAIPLAVGVFGQAGDLLESLFKREAGVKDSSQFIPGHGGFLDRFDSLLVSAPVFYAYLILTS